MTIKDKLSAEPGFLYVIDQMELMSSLGRRRMLEQPFLTDRDSLLAEYGNTRRILSLLRSDDCSHAVAVIRHQLMMTHDLHGTLLNLQHHLVLEEIELFEIKNFSFLCMETRKAAESLGISDVLNIPDMSPLFTLLDPDNTNIPNFYIYDSYHPQLAELRSQLRAKQTLLDQSNKSVEENAPLQREINELFEKQNILQQEVIERLSEQLFPHLDTLDTACKNMAYTDFLFAKATLADKWGLCSPQILEDNNAATCLKELWNPRLKERIESLGQRYQRIDIEVHNGVCLVTGANMAGKTVLLKSIGICQLLAQFGFYLPAESAQLTMVDDVVFCIGDEQNEMNGLSSFASEIIKISDTLKLSKEHQLLILIDEPARTTNPVEGKAIVQAVSTILGQRNSKTLITTHYSQLGLPCRRLRVKGFAEDMSNLTLSPENINQFMDYSLLEDNSDEVPQEALRIATILNCDSEMLQTAKQFL